MEDFGAAWSSMEQYGELWSSLEQYGALWSSLEQLGAGWSTMEQLGALGAAIEQWWSSYGALGALGAAMEQWWSSYGAPMEHLEQSWSTWISRRTRTAELLSIRCSFFCSCWTCLRCCPSLLCPLLILSSVSSRLPNSSCFTMVFTTMYFTKSKFYANYCWNRLILTCNCSLIYFLLGYYKFRWKATRNLTKTEFNEAADKITS